MPPEKAINVEYQQGVNMAEAASQVEELEQYIWSTLPDSEAISGKKYYIPHFCGKGRVDKVIKEEFKALYNKTTFLTIPVYGDNFQYAPVTPRPIVSASQMNFLPSCQYC